MATARSSAMASASGESSLRPLPSPICGESPLMKFSRTGMLVVTFWANSGRSQ